MKYLVLAFVVILGSCKKEEIILSGIYEGTFISLTEELEKNQENVEIDFRIHQFSQVQHHPRSLGEIGKGIFKVRNDHIIFENRALTHGYPSPMRLNGIYDFVQSGDSIRFGKFDIYNGSIKSIFRLKKQ